jgi:hypothetical protein
MHCLHRFECVAILASPLCLVKKVSIPWWRNERALFEFVPVSAALTLFMPVHCEVGRACAMARGLTVLCCRGGHGAVLSGSDRARTSVLAGLFQLLASNRSSCSTIRFAALPSHFGGIVPFFHCLAINRASAGGSLPGLVPMSSLVPIVMVSGRSVLSRRVKHGKLFDERHAPCWFHLQLHLRKNRLPVSHARLSPV